MKRSFSSDEDEQFSRSEYIKKSKVNESISNESYYVIRKGRSTTTSDNSVANMSKSASSSFLDKKDKRHFDGKKDRSLDSAKRSNYFDNKNGNFYDSKNSENKSDKRSHSSKDRYAPFDKKDRFDSFKSKSTTSLEQNEPYKFRHAGFNIKLPTSFSQTDLVKDLENSLDKDRKPTSGYVIRKTGGANVQSTSELSSFKEQFLNMARSKNLNYKLDYTVKLSFGGKEIIVSDTSFEEAERKLFQSAIENLQQESSRINDEPQDYAEESMIEEPNESDKIIEEIKQEDSDLYLRKLVCEIIQSSRAMFQ